MPFACECGEVSGFVRQATPSQGDHIVCCCSDCRDLARHFRKESRILEDHGGTPLYQSRCARLEIGTGKHRLACLHMTEQATTRWYAECCGTPLFNTYKNGRIPYVTTLLGNCDPASVDARLGQPLGYLFLDEATGDTSKLPAMPMSRLIRRFFLRMVKDILSGDRRRNPLFDASTLEPIAAPRRLRMEERNALL
nr:DUF6151 family protein [Qipengyuania proteolytica]